MWSFKDKKILNDDDENFKLIICDYSKTKILRDDDDQNLNCYVIIQEVLNEVDDS